MICPDHAPPRILLIDDNPAIHEDYKKILGAHRDDSDLDATKAALFGPMEAAPAAPTFELTHASQGEEGLACLRQGLADGRRFGVAFVDIRMPPGWDGIETTARLWEADPTLQVVICTAYSDYSWRDITKRLGASENLLVLKKPFDNIEVIQFAYALAAKWQLMQAAQLQIGQLEHFVAKRTRQLQQAQEIFSKAFKLNPLPMLIHRLHDGSVVDANPALCGLLGYTLEEMINRPISAQGRWADTLLAWPPGGAGPATKIEPSVVVVTREGIQRQVLLFPEEFEIDGTPCRLVLLQDITERSKAESDARQTQKMEAIGQLAAGVAHDFNNILTVIQGWMSMALAKSQDPDISHGLTQALKAGDRAGALTRHLLAYSRKQVIERRCVALDSLFEQMKGMLVRLIGEHIEIKFHVAPGIPCAYVDRGNLDQVILNLAVNARDAMPNGGTLTIDAFAVETRASPMGAPPASGGYNNGFICIRVTDTGTGMDELTKSRIFEPFFTTKDVGEGTGMGLATVQGIVKQHQGWIEVDTSPQKGSTFRVFIPAAADEGLVGAAPAFPQPLARRVAHETILLVEDEIGVLEFAQALLTAKGYRVLAAPNAAAAISIWKRESHNISLLFTDMVMPGVMGGKKLAEQLKAEKADLHVIYTSGYSADLVECRIDGPRIFLQKPYTGELLERTVRSCLEAAHQAAAPKACGLTPSLSHRR